MNTSSDQLSFRYVFSRSLRYPYMMNALRMAFLGIVVVFIGASRDHVVQPFFGEWLIFFLLKIIGGAYTIVALGALVLHAIANLTHETQIIEVDAEGLKITHFDKEGKTTLQALKWDEVASYKVSVYSNRNLKPVSEKGSEKIIQGGLFLGVLAWGTGFFLPMIFGVFTQLMMKSLVPSSRKSVTFKLSTQPALSFNGFGIPMAELVIDVLPHFLPDKIT